MTGTDIEIARKYLINEDVVAIPTETVYGLAGNAYSEKAVFKIFEVKQRPSFDPLIVHASSINRIIEFTQDIPEMALSLFEKFSPGPITVLLTKKNTIPDLVTSGLPRVAVRIPSHSLALELLQQLSFPLAAPSANPFGYISPTTAKHVQNQLHKRIPYILDGGDSNIGVESTIVGFEEGKPVIYRLGGVSVEDIEKITGKIKVLKGNSYPAAPGMLKSHYAPQKPLYMGNINFLMNKFNDKTVGILSFTKKYEGDYSFVLSKDGSFEEASRNLFKFLRLLDECEAEIIIGEYLPEENLGRAINDRLSRAAVND